MALQKLVESYKAKVVKTLPIQESSQLVESNTGKKYESRGAYTVEISRYDQENLNNRIYSKKLWENVIKNQKHIYEGAPGLMDHPESDGSTKDVFCVYHNLKMNEQNKTIEADMYLVGRNGQDVKEQLDAGGYIELSTSGMGQISESDGKTVEEDSFQLERPGDNVFASSQQVYIRKENEMTEACQKKNEEELEPDEKEISEEDNDEAEKELEEAKKYDLMYAGMGNGITIVNKTEQEYGDYKKIAHIDRQRKITYFDKSLPNDIKKEIEDYAKNENPNISATQKGKVFEEGEKWSGDVETKWTPPENFFTQSAEKIASGLKSASSDLKQAMGRLNFYINRAGDNLSADDKSRLENAKDLLSKKYESKQSDENLTIYNIEENKNIIEMDSIMKDLKDLTLEQKNFRISMTNFIKEANEISEIEDKIARFSEMLEWCHDLNENNQKANQPIKTIIEQRLSELNEEYDNLAMKGKNTDKLAEKVDELQKMIEEKDTTFNELNEHTSELYEKFDEIKDFTNLLQEKYDKAVEEIKKYKKHFIEKAKMTEAVGYIEKLEKEIVSLRKIKEEDEKEIDDLTGKLNDIEAKKQEEEEELENMIAESQRKVKEKKIQEKFQEMKTKKEEKEKTSSFESVKADVYDLYNTWLSETPKIEKFKEEILSCRNIREAQTKYLKLRDYLYEDCRSKYASSFKFDYEKALNEDRSALYESKAILKEEKEEKPLSIPQNWV